MRREVRGEPMLLVEHEAAFVEQHHHVGGAFAFDGRRGLQQLRAGHRERGRIPGLGGAGVGGDEQGGEGQEQAA